MNEKITKKLKKLIKKTEKSNDIPVACIIVKNNEIIASDYNKKYKNNNPLDHAEILAIKKACKKLGRTNLSDCELYTSLYPCNMCEAVINETRIKTVYYILDKEKNVNNSIKYSKILTNDYDYFNSILKGFFNNKR